MTPGCSVCGYVVEVVRSCFRSRWRLFRGRSETTDGRYIFAPDNAPCYPGPHNLWSKDWVSDELGDYALGEDSTATRQWVNGAAIGPVPGPELIGSADCIRNGETWPLATIPTLRGGFDARCPEIVPEPWGAIDVRAPGNRCYWAQILAQTYTAAAAARARVAATLGVPDTGYALLLPNALTPCYWILTAAPPEPLVIGIAGTATPQQWIQQIAFGVGPPTAQGGFASNPVWYSVASTILDKLLDLAVPATQDVVIAGHSMGAAVAAVLAARLRLGQPTRRIQILGLGCPRPGDDRLARLLLTTDAQFLADEDDPVPGIPSNIEDLPAALQVLFGALYPIGCPLWVFPPNRFRVFWDGTVEEGAAQPGPAAVVQSILNWGLAGGPAPDFSAHLPGEYQRRLCAPVALPDEWLDTGLLAAATGDVVPVLPNRVNPANSAELQNPALPVFFIRDNPAVRCVCWFRGNACFFFPHAVTVPPGWTLAAVIGWKPGTGSTGADNGPGVPFAGSPATGQPRFNVTSASPPPAGPVRIRRRRSG